MIDYEAEFAAVKEMARFCASRGWQALPTRCDRKRPLVGFKEFWERKFDYDVFDPQFWNLDPPDLRDKGAPPHQPYTTNLQLMTGRHWGLIAYDLDGDEAKKLFPTWGWLPRTWVTHSGGGGEHWIFRAPKDHPTPLPSGHLWLGEGHHSGIERLCDKSLLMLPPSRHPDHPERRYVFKAGCSPSHLTLPAMVPSWLLSMKTLDEKRRATRPPRPARQPVQHAPSSGRNYRFDQVLDAIPDKIAVAESWGIRFTGRTTSSGWAECRAYDRQDEAPSAVVHTENGFYVDRGSGVRLGLFDLGVQLGIASTPHEVLQILGDQYVSRA